VADAKSQTIAPSWRKWLPTRERLLANRWLAWLAPWLGHPALWHWSRHGVALGVALGVFFGLLIPIAQIPVTAAAAVVLRANLPAAAASTLISNPVTFAPLYYAAFELGSWVTGEATPPLTPFDASADEAATLSVWERIRALGKPLMVGLALLAVASGALTYGVIYLVWGVRTRWRRRRRRRVNSMVR